MFISKGHERVSPEAVHRVRQVIPAYEPMKESKMDRIKRFSGILVAVLILSATEGRAAWVDDFDSYATGSQLHGQGGWKGWDNDSTWTAPTSGAQSFSAPNSAEIGGNADLVHEYSEVGGQVQFSTMQYIPSNAAGQSFFLLLNEYNDGGPYDWSVQLNFDLTVGQVVSDLGGGATAPIVRDNWVELLFDIDLDANTVDEYYNGSLLASHQWDDTLSNTFGAVDLFGNGASPIYYDNMSLAEPSGEVVPEPASIVLAAFGLLGLGLLGWRRRAA